MVATFTISRDNVTFYSKRNKSVKNFVTSSLLLMLRRNIRLRIEIRQRFFSDLINRLRTLFPIQNIFVVLLYNLLIIERSILKLHWRISFFPSLRYSLTQAGILSFNFFFPFRYPLTFLFSVLSLPEKHLEKEFIFSNKREIGE